MVITDYLDALSTDHLQRSVAKTVDLLFSHSDEFDAIAFRGVSGALVAPSVAAILGKNLLLVRKPTELSHACGKVEGFRGKAQRYIIIDDFISEGTTTLSVIDSVREFYKQHTCVAIALYNWKGKTTAFMEEFKGIPLWKVDQ